MASLVPLLIALLCFVGECCTISRDVYPYLPMAPNVPWAILGGGYFIKSSVISFDVQDIVRFAMDVSVEFSLYKSPYNCCHVSLSLSEPKLQSSPDTSTTVGCKGPGHRSRRRESRGGHVPPKIREKYFSGNYYVKLGHFVSKNHVKFGNFGNSSGKYHKNSGILLIFRA